MVSFKMLARAAEESDGHCSMIKSSSEQSASDSALPSKRDSILARKSAFVRVLCRPLDVPDASAVKL